MKKYIKRYIALVPIIGLIAVIFWEPNYYSGENEDKVLWRERRPVVYYLSAVIQVISFLYILEKYFHFTKTIIKLYL